MTLHRRLLKLENNPEAIVLREYNRLIPLIESFRATYDACFAAWYEALKPHIARLVPGILYLFDDLEAIRQLPEDEQDAAGIAHTKAHYEDVKELNKVFSDLVQAARRGDIDPLVDCTEYHALDDLMYKSETATDDFQFKHPDLVESLRQKLQEHIQETIERDEQIYR